jgi:2-dehydro-3-deoxygluconokinase
VSQLRKGDVDWDTVFSAGRRWFHTGGIFAGLSDTTVDVADEAMAAARRHGATVSYDPNYPPASGPAGAAPTGPARSICGSPGTPTSWWAPWAWPGGTRDRRASEPTRWRTRSPRSPGLLPEAKVLATTLREVPSAGVNDWSSAAWSAETGFVTAPGCPATAARERSTL